MIQKKTVVMRSPTRTHWTFLCHGFFSFFFLVEVFFCYDEAKQRNILLHVRKQLL
jgi:hypothetical protein